MRGSSPFVIRSISNFILFTFILTATGLGQGNIITLIFKVLLLFVAIREFNRRGTNSNYSSNSFYLWSLLIILMFWASLAWAVNGMLGVSTSMTVTVNIIYCILTYYLINGNQPVLNSCIDLFIIGSIIFTVYLFFTNGGNLGREDEDTGASVLNMGHLAAISIVFCFYKFDHDKKNKLTDLILILILFIIVLISGTRKALILPFLCIGLFSFLKMNGIYKIKAIIFTTFLLILGYYVVMKIPIFYDMIGVRIETMISGFTGGDKETSDASTLQRLSFIAFGLEGIFKRPWFGYGPDSFVYMYTKANPGAWSAYSHNNFIEICYSIGIIGLVIYYSIYFIILNKLWKNYKQHKNRLNLLLFTLLIGIIIIHYGWVAYYSMTNNLVLIFAASMAFKKNVNIVRNNCKHTLNLTK